MSYATWGRRDPEVAGRIIRECVIHSRGSFEVDGSPTDLYRLIAARLTEQPYERVTSSQREAIKRTVHAAGYA